MSMMSNVAIASFVYLPSSNTGRWPSRSARRLNSSTKPAWRWPRRGDSRRFWPWRCKKRRLGPPAMDPAILTEWNRLVKIIGVNKLLSFFLKMHFGFFLCLDLNLNLLIEWLLMILLWDVLSTKELQQRQRADASHWLQMMRLPNDAPAELKRAHLKEAVMALKQLVQDLTWFDMTWYEM